VTAPPPASEPPETLQREDNPPVAVPLIVWLLVQLAAVALAASGVELSANFPRPPQSLAVQEMLVAQFVGSAIFFPVLFRGWRAWAAMVVTAGPMLIVAARLAGAPVARVLPPWVEVSAWVTMLALWRAALVRRESDSTPGKARGLQAPGLAGAVSAAATLLSAGGLLAWYLHSEFQPERNLLLFPLSATLVAFTTPGTRFPSPLLSTAALAVAALVILAIRRILHAQKPTSGQPQITHSSNPK
jgi:hypothetical protein